MLRPSSQTGIALLALLPALLLALMLAAAPAQAHAKGKGGHDYYDRGHGYHDRHHGRDYGRGRDYRRDYRPKGRPHQYHHHHHHYAPKQRSNEAAYLLGGIVIGSVLTHALQPPRAHYAPAPAVVYHAPVYGRRLLQDTYGNCFERRGEGAREVLIPLPQWECTW
jgi:hypothetical protein